MARRNRVDPWGDLVAHPARGMFTGNRGCVVDDHENVVRHHKSNLLWITCRLEFRGWRVPLARPHRWTPLFFLDDAVALAAGHRPCGECRREDYLSYRDGVTETVAHRGPLSATELNRRLADERLRPGRGLDGAADRKLWWADLANLPLGTVVLDGRRRPCLWSAQGVRPFEFTGWGAADRSGPHLDLVPRWDTLNEAFGRAEGSQRGTRTDHLRRGRVEVLTPPTSVAALSHGFVPVLHPSATAER